jgi:L-lactate dehydrogenase complex protein LldF
MPEIFHSRIDLALADADLQVALDGNAEKRIAGRQQAFASVSDYQERRQRAHAVRADVIAHLDGYLEKFTQRVQENGFMIHHAADGKQAVEIILGIIQQNKAKLIAKSKTMVSEEIHLNHLLEAAGLRVVETDLGEFIVQIRGEKPSHIITPAVHLRRGQVGQTFHEKLGVPYTDSIPEMTAVARRTLREIFLSAEVGLSGVNFGVVETGTLCVMTNEGNGRMVTTVPPVHIALMGMERIVPTLDDLALMMSLLPRSATGQKMTVYASLLHGPRRPQDPDGPAQRHLVLLDNGRAALRSTPLAEILYCIRCGACLNACPIFREIGGHAYIDGKGNGATYTGPMGSVLSPALFGQAEFGQLARASSLCGACKEACPVDIDLPKLLLRVRAGGKQIETKQTPDHVPLALNWGLRLFTWAAKSPWRFHAAQKLAGIFSRVAAPSSTWIRLPAVTGWGYSKDFPRPALRLFHELVSAFAETAPQKNRLETNPASKVPEAEPGSGFPKTSPNPLDTVAERMRRFEVELTALDGNFACCKRAELANKVWARLQERKITAILSWEASLLPAGLLDFLQGKGIKLIHQPDPTVEAGLTGALAGVAETATLVLPGGPGRPLTASLLPQVHIAVLKAEDILPDMASALRLPEVRQSSAAALVSGPSRTADIEMTLTLGVHGPKELHVFCVVD